MCWGSGLPSRGSCSLCSVEPTEARAVFGSAPEVISRGSENGPVEVPGRRAQKEVPDNHVIVASSGIALPCCSSRDVNELRVVVVGLVANRDELSSVFT